MVVPPEKLQLPFIVSSFGFIFTLIGLLAWSVSAAGGVGPLWAIEAQPLHGNFGWAMMLGIAGILGSWGGGTLGQSDWTRYANRPFAPIVAQTVVGPLCIFVCGLVGIIATSAASGVLGGGQILWEPFKLLPAIQAHYGHSAGVRAAVFFAGAGCTGAQLGIDVVLNSVSAGMDLAGVVPRYINIRRGAYLMACLGFAVNPWQYLSNAAIFLTVISGFGIFLAPFTGVMVADYLVVRRQRLVIRDLYVQRSESIYWFTGGFNARALVAWVLGVWPLFPGFVLSITDAEAWNGWVQLFRLNFFVGFSISFVAMVVVNRMWPPSHLNEGVLRHDDEEPFGLLQHDMSEHEQEVSVIEKMG
ncbi:unnamed protein product [Discula destructiva]